MITVLLSSMQRLAAPPKYFSAFVKNARQVKRFQRR